MAVRDAIKADVKGVIQKKGYLHKNSMNEAGITISASVEAGVVMLDIPEEQIKISCRLQDVMAVLTESNRAYKQALSENSLLVKGNISQSNP